MAPDDTGRDDGTGPRPDPDDGADGGPDHEVDDLAAQPVDRGDERALDALARAVDVRDPVPPGLVERATFAVALEELEVEVAMLQREAVADGRALAGVRGGEDHSLTMTFTASALSLTLAVVETARDLHRIDGWITTESPEVAVTLRLGEADRRDAEVDAGRFAFTDVPSGMVQVVVGADTGDAAMVVTPVFEL